jgi:hypothetical protein
MSPADCRLFTRHNMPVGRTAHSIAEGRSGPRRRLTKRHLRRVISAVAGTILEAALGCCSRYFLTMITGKTQTVTMNLFLGRHGSSSNLPCPKCPPCTGTPSVGGSVVTRRHSRRTPVAASIVGREKAFALCDHSYVVAAVTTTEGQTDSFRYR